MSNSFLPFPRTLRALLLLFAAGETGQAAPGTAPLRSENAGREAARILETLAKPLEQEGHALQADLITPGFTCGPLRPGTPVPAWNGPEAAVVRFPGGGTVPGRKGPAALEEAWRGLAAAWGKTAGRHAKFKITRVDLSGAPLIRTRLLFSFTAETPEGPAEHSATWDVSWEELADSTPERPELRLHAIRCLSAEEARAKTGPWLTDRTDALLSGGDSLREQLGHGNVWWRARFQKQFEQYIYGHRGIAAGDANGDGLDDVYLCMEGGLPNRLLLQQADGTARDAARESGVDFLDSTRSALFLDLDSDGDQDLVMAMARGILLMENTGGGRFTQKALLPRVTDAYSLAAADYDSNGTMDIYGCGYQAREADPARVATPVPFYDARNGGEDFLIRNDGHWRFSNATTETGLDQNNNRFSFAAVWTDFDNDGDSDIVVANDFGKNNLFEQRRDAAGKITFVDTAAERGLAGSAFGMSVTAGDFNRDGAMDLYVGNMFSSAGNRITRQPEFKKGVPHDILERFRVLAGGNALFLNDGRGHYRDFGESAGVAMGRWTWGTLAADLNNDGWEDILVGNGNITGHGPAPDL